MTQMKKDRPVIYKVITRMEKRVATLTATLGIDGVDLFEIDEFTAILPR
jgi:hypothetical protein